MTTVTREFVEALINFAPTEEQRRMGFADTQTEGTVALFNMLQRNRCAYLADEVGMGKTYVALGVMSLVRYFNPAARIIVIAPRENIQLKWQKELTNFVRNNWKISGNRVKSLQGSPAWPPKVAGSLIDFAQEAQLNADRDFFLRMTSFSIVLSDPDSRKKLRRKLLKAAPWLNKSDIPNHTAEGFRDGFAAAFNRIIPSADLVIVDEAHNLKHGFGENVSTRNRVMGIAFGRPDSMAIPPKGYQQRVARLLFLSATPFEDDYAAIQRQLDIFGFGDIETYDAHGQDPLSVSLLADPEVSEWEKRRVVGRLLIRRVSGIKMGGQLHTKNMYRREWRLGGYQDHGKPMTIEDPKQRLIVALMQKKVAEVLQHERFNNSFQIGMLSSFESFLESTDTTLRAQQATAESGEAELGAVFDGEDQLRLASDAEKRGIDTDSIRGVVQSYRDRFGRALPHPKLDATADALKTAFESGEKTLVFVRRVATVSELAAKLDEFFDRWIKARMQQCLPALTAEIDELFSQYEADRRKRPEELLEQQPKDAEESRQDIHPERVETEADEDQGSAETFFAWFFRGEGPQGFLSGAAFRKNRFDGESSIYSNVFEDDLVAWLLERPENPLERLAEALNLQREPLVDQLRTSAWARYREHTQRQEGYPRRKVFYAYQAAALVLLADANNSYAQQARVILQQRFPDYQSVADAVEPVPDRFPSPEEAIGITTLFTELVKRDELRQFLWPRSKRDDFAAGFREREQRRELLGGMARLGAAYIDLYMLAIEELGSFRLGGRGDEGLTARELVTTYLDLLDKQRELSGFHGFRELANAAANFDLLVSVNFPDIPNEELRSLSRIYGATLQRQMPVGRMAGGVNKRLVRQFRMPGYPLVLIATDVLQEGEDLHTFCRRVVHYGISWTPSATEQRTGRIDRIGGLVQRELDGRETPAAPEELIQVYYPHLSDTVEVLQVRRVLKRLNRFLELIHRMGRDKQKEQSTLNVARELLDAAGPVPQITGPLESAFPVDATWSAGDLNSADAQLDGPEAVYAHLDTLWRQLLARLPITEDRRTEDRKRSGTIDLTGVTRPDLALELPADSNETRFECELLSQTAAEHVVLRCSCHVAEMPLNDPEVLNALYQLQKELMHPRICARPADRPGVDNISIEVDLLFHPETTQLEEVESLIVRVTTAGSVIRDRMGPVVESAA